MRFKVMVTATIMLMLVCAFGCKKHDPNNEGGNSIIAPTGAIKGLFSVSSSTQVFFSQGNLQFQASRNIWRFANNQYDYLGFDNSNVSSTYDGWIDLFGWGTSGYSHGAVCYQPWSTSESNLDYYPYNSSVYYNLYDHTGQADWGYNSISNGGNINNKWRTLTQAEWNYVFNIRNTSSGIRYVKAQVNGINGVILLPDNWKTSYFELYNINDGTYDSNIIDHSNWCNKLQNNGAVFLPAAGNRIGSTVSFSNTSGDYWSSSHNGEREACEVWFVNSKIKTDFSGPRHYGFSVRLVQELDQTNNGEGNDNSDLHEYVDLGLPSGTLWATCNVGANKSEDYGNYFAWGETEFKLKYDLSTYKYCNGEDEAHVKYTKYCIHSNWGLNGFVDSLVELLPSDDAATVNWGNSWRTPSCGEWEELLGCCTNEWIEQNGVKGRLFTSTNGNTLFLPAAGCYRGEEFCNDGRVGHYWTSHLHDRSSSNAMGVTFSEFFCDTIVRQPNVRWQGWSVRPVKSFK